MSKEGHAKLEVGKVFCILDINNLKNSLPKAERADVVLGVRAFLKKNKKLAKGNEWEIVVNCPPLNHWHYFSCGYIMEENKANVQMG